MLPLFFGEIAGDRACLRDAEGHHAASVMRIGVGERISVSDNGGTLVTVEVDRVAKGEIEGFVVDRIVVQPTQPAITVAQALIKGESMGDAVDLMTQVGVAAIIPWQAEHCVAQWRDERVGRALERLRSAALSAAKQSRNPLVPSVDRLHDLTALLARFAEFDRVLVLHEQGDVPLADLAPGRAERILLIVGPEGGLSQAELSAFQQVGAQPYLLGPTVLRSSTAGAIASAVVAAISS